MEANRSQSGNSMTNLKDPFRLLAIEILCTDLDQKWRSTVQKCVLHKSAGWWRYNRPMWKTRFICGSQGVWVPYLQHHVLSSSSVLLPPGQRWHIPLGHCRHILLQLQIQEHKCKVPGYYLPPILNSFNLVNQPWSLSRKSTFRVWFTRLNIWTRFYECLPNPPF